MRYLLRTNEWISLNLIRLWMQPQWLEIFAGELRFQQYNDLRSIRLYYFNFIRVLHLPAPQRSNTIPARRTNTGSPLGKDMSDKWISDSAGTRPLVSLKSDTATFTQMHDYVSTMKKTQTFSHELTHVHAWIWISNCNAGGSWRF